VSLLRSAKWVSFGTGFVGGKELGIGHPGRVIAIMQLDVERKLVSRGTADLTALLCTCYGATVGTGSAMLLLDAATRQWMRVVTIFQGTAVTSAFDQSLTGIMNSPVVVASCSLDDDWFVCRICDRLFGCCLFPCLCFFLTTSSTLVGLDFLLRRICNIRSFTPHRVDMSDLRVVSMGKLIS
jgi:hypothetical protein